MIRKKKNIMVVDDSYTMRSLLICKLKESGFGCIEAHNGKFALELAQQHKVHLLLTDINMPEMDGITLVKRIKELPEYRFLKVVMVTTEYDNSIKEKAKEAGASGWITKPVGDDTLMQMIDRLV